MKKIGNRRFKIGKQQDQVTTPMDSSHNDDRPSDDNNGLPEKEIPWIFGKPEKCDSAWQGEHFYKKEYVIRKQ